MKGLIRSTAAAVVATLLISNADAQVKLDGTVNTATKVTANTSKVANAATGATKAATGAVKTTTKAATGAVKSTTNAAVNAAKKVDVKASSSTRVAGSTTATDADGKVKVDANVHADGSKAGGKAEEVKNEVVAEAHQIRETVKEERRDVKPGLNISNKTEAGNSGETTVSEKGIKAKGETEVSSETKVDADAKAVKDKVKSKAEEVKDKTKDKVKDVKAAKGSVKAEGKVETTGKVQAGKQ